MNSQTDLDFPTFVALLRRRAKLIIGIAVVAAALAFGISSLLPDSYEANADLLFHIPVPTPLVNPNEPGAEASPEPERIAATNLALASLDVISVRVAQRGGISKSAKELRESVSIEPNGQADVVTISATAGTPEEAAQIANAFAEEVVRLRRESARSKVQKVISAIQTQLETGPPIAPEAKQHLESRVSQLEVQKRLEAGDAEIVEEAIPPKNPSSPKPLQNALIGAALGLLLGMVLAVLLRRFDRRVRDESDIEQVVGAPIIGRIPLIKGKGGWTEQLLLESFQFLRTNLQLRSATSDSRVIAVCSALPGDGKSTIGVRLAEAFALSGFSVILVDCDLRRPVLHATFGLHPDRGVTTALTTNTPAVDLLVETSIAGVRLLPAGPPSGMPGTLVTGDHDIGRLVSELRAAADYVIFDTSPLTIGADASTIASEVDGVLMIVDQNTAKRKLLEAAVTQLRNAETKIAGVALNRAEVLLDDRSYRGYYSRPPLMAPPGPAIKSRGPAEMGSDTPLN